MTLLTYRTGLKVMQEESVYKLIIDTKIETFIFARFVYERRISFSRIKLMLKMQNKIRYIMNSHLLMLILFTLSVKIGKAVEKKTLKKLLKKAQYLSIWYVL